MNSEMEPLVTTCGKCHSPMPRDLRFCRNCGFRLGEGPAEYTETVRFKDAPPGIFPGSGPATSFPPYVAPGGPMAAATGGQIGKRRRRMSGMTWMFLALLIFFIGAAAFTAVIRPIRNIAAVARPAPPPRSYVGVSPFKTTEGGVTFDNVEPPGSPADKAGLVGGDVITILDGQTVTDEDEAMDLLSRIPVGKTVDVVYIRDGETKTTKLTTVSKEEFDRLARLFSNRPEGKGRFGIDDNTDRVQIPGTKMFGVKLDDVSPSLPADMAGIKEGDIVIQFGDADIRTPEELSSRIKRALPYSTVKVVVMRGSERIEIPVKMGRQS